jgi:hypothetical protein
MAALAWLKDPVSRRGVALYSAYRLLSAWLVALPTAQLVSQSLEHHPDGDALLFRPGGVYLLELFRVQETGLRAAAQVSAGLLVVLMLGSVLPLSWLLASLVGSRQERESWIVRGVRIAPRILGLWVMGVMAQALWLLCSVLLASLLWGVLDSGFSEPTRDLVGLAPVPLALPGWLLLRAFLDLVLLASSSGHRWSAAYNKALAALLDHPLPLGLLWLSVHIAAAGAIQSAFVANHALGAAAAPAWSQALATATEALALLALCILHASWLSGAAHIIARGDQATRPPAQ